MKTIREDNQFRRGHTYFSETRQGRIRKFEVLKVMASKETGKRLYVIAKYDGKPEQRYDIRVTTSGVEYVIADQRFCTAVDTTELVDEMKITDSMISEAHVFNNCGQCVVTVDGKRFPASWDHGKVTADAKIVEAFHKYIYG